MLRNTQYFIVGCFFVSNFVKNKFMLPILHYIAILGKRESSPLPIVPPDSLIHTLMRNIGRFPHSLEHFIYGVDFYQAVLFSGGKSGHNIGFIYAEDLESLDGQFLAANALNIFLICTEDEDCVIKANIELSRIHQKDCVYLISESNNGKFIMPNVFTSENNFWTYLYEYVRLNLIIDESRLPFCVPIFAKAINTEYSFFPTIINSNTLNSMVGNWNYHKEKTLGSASQESANAIKEMHSFARQDMLTNQIKVLYAIEIEAKNIFDGKVLLKDQFFAPLILALPYTNIDVRKTYTQHAIKNGGNKSIAKDIEFILSQEYTHNYCFSTDFSKSKLDNPAILGSAIRYFFQPRSLFLDIVGQLHASFKFSPYLRLPFQGVGINKELSFVGTSLNTQLTFSKDRQAIMRIMTKIGTMLADNTLSPEIKEMFKKRPSQIVALSDLPVEWINIDGIPLGFTHDICRLPETPVTGLLTHHQINLVQKYIIPKDILRKTLVVYGCREAGFKEWQDKVDVLSERIGFKTCVCTSIDEFAQNVHQHKPDFLIIDSHGGTDLTNHQSYILMGSEKMYPSDIVKKQISSPLVFLSACNTAPTYNSINTIANALFEVGSLSVTTSYMPLDIKESSVLYIRILNQLSQAANHFYHKNWLAFISHIQRTSFILNPLVGIDEKTEEDAWVSAEKKGEILAISMFFENRRELYENLQKGEIPNGFKANYSNVTPHYLMYSTLGRADLIEFECFSPKRWSK